MVGGVPGDYRVFREITGCYEGFQRVFGGFRGVPGDSRGVPGGSGDVMGAFRDFHTMEYVVV